jgi:hypothetical protein
MVDFENIHVKEVIDHIRHRREENRLKLEETNKLVMELIRLGRLAEAKRLIDESASKPFTLYAKAEEHENGGDLEYAAELLWENIYANGADAAANFKKLMDILRKLECCEGELKVAEIYLHFTDRFGVEEILARIENLRKMLASA